MASSATPGLLKLQEKLGKELDETLRQEELDETLRQEELLWMPKSRVNWLCLGDKNTRLFDTATLIRRCHNKILILKNEKGEWIDDQQQLKELAITFFSNLFRSKPRLGSEYLKGQFPLIPANKQQMLLNQCTKEEITGYIKAMGLYKCLDRMVSMQDFSNGHGLL